MERTNVRSNEVRVRSLSRIAGMALDWRLGERILSVRLLLNRIHKLSAIIWLEGPFKSIAIVAMR